MYVIFSRGSTSRTCVNYYFQSFPDIHFAIQQAISYGDYATITRIMTGNNLGGIAHFPPTNKSINTSGFTIYHFKNARICGHSQVFDRTTVMKQLGFYVNRLAEVFSTGFLQSKALRTGCGVDLE